MITRTWVGPPLPETFIRPDASREIGLMLRDRIDDRTRRGVDAKGAPFVPLSDGYAKAKGKAGLAPVADLQVSGRMLNDMGVTDATSRTVTLGFRSAGGGGGRGTFIQRSRALGAADKAYFHCVEGAGKSKVIRDFFDLSESDIKAAVDMVDAMIADAIG